MIFMASRPGGYLKLFRSKGKGVADLLQYAALVDSGVVQLKDGGLIAGFFYQGEDPQSITNERIEQISAQANRALARLGSGWASHIDAVRLPTAAYSDPQLSAFPDPVTQAIDNERRAHFMREGRHFETQHAIVLKYTPPIRAKNKVVDLIYDDDGVDESPADRQLKIFQAQLGEIQGNLSAVMSIRRMGSYSYTDSFGRTHHGDELVDYVQAALTGEPHPVNIPPVPMYLDAILGGQELWTGDTPKYGGKYITCVAIEGYPAESYPGILNLLDNMAIAYRFSSRMIYMDRPEALAALNKYKRRWTQKVRGFVSQVFKVENGNIDADALFMAQETDGEITNAHSGVVTFGYYTPVIVLMGEDRAELMENARIIVRELVRDGFAARVETVNTMQAWLGSLPGHTDENVRRPLLHTLALADMLPLFGIWPGHSEHPCPFYPAGSPPLLQGATTGSTPFRLNLHYGDLGHTLIFGPPGAGKSALLATIAASHRRYPNATVTAFDKGASMMALCLAVGGDHYDVGGEGQQLGFCPLQHLETDSDVAWATEWVETLYRLQHDGAAPSPEQRAAITHAVKQMRDLSGHRSLSDFVTTVQDREVRAAVEHYTMNGPLGALLDAEQDNLGTSKFSVFEVEDLMSKGDINAIPVLLYLFRRFERSLKGQPALLILDEAWIMLGNKVFRDKIQEWLRVLRKQNCAVIMATQSLSDSARSGLLDILAETCPTKIYLPNEQAMMKGSDKTLGPSDYYAALGLNPRQIELLANAVKKRHYYFTSPEGQRLFTLELGPITLAFVGVSDKESVRRVRQLHAEHGRNWPARWLAERRVEVPEILEVPHAQAA